MKISILGAESTGKTQLSQLLAATLRARGHSVALVAEHLRAWCDAQGRTPLAHEQMGIAQEQAAQADASTADYLVADTAPLMIAVYSHYLFNDTSLYPMALTHQATYDHTLLTGLDLPWVADGLQRDGAHAREPVDALLRSALDRAGLRYAVVYGRGEQRLAAALVALGIATESIATKGLFTLALPGKDSKSAPWKWVCDKCSDPVCEHRLFTELLTAPSP